MGQMAKRGTKELEGLIMWKEMDIWLCGLRGSSKAKQEERKCIGLPFL